MPQYLDIHAHVNFETFDDDRKEVIARALDAGVWHTNVGTTYETSKEVVELAEQYDEGVYAIVGIHPVQAADGDTDTCFETEKFRKLTQSSRVVGIGECGLDYFRVTSETKEIQEEVFRAQIELALETSLPLMIHPRPSKGTMDAYEDILDILEEYHKEVGEKLSGNAHFFVGDTKIAKRFLNIGFTMSFTGVITFAKEYAELVRYIPLDMMHAETDCPFVAPVPHRGKRNEPVYVIEMVKKIAEIKELPLRDVQTQLLENSRRVFPVGS